ncbi:hypothetical protein K1719_046161 [Acacia pycnantha]|nr:hypothetical protein K1719_046161 [Acacia pycnantha]
MSKRDFCDLVKNTLQKDSDFKRKVAVIQDLRPITSQVLHYYRGDFLDELPGLLDFAVVLNPSSQQKQEVHRLNYILRKFMTNVEQFIDGENQRDHGNPRPASSRSTGFVVDVEDRHGNISRRTLDVSALTQTDWEMAGCRS